MKLTAFAASQKEEEEEQRVDSEILHVGYLVYDMSNVAFLLPPLCKRFSDIWK